MAKKHHDHSAKRKSPLRILVALRPNESGAEAIRFAAWLARTTTIQVRVATVFIRPWPSTSLSKLGGKYRKWYNREADACREKVTAKLEDAGIAADQWDSTVSIFLDGSSETQLVTQAAAEFGADVILLGSHGAAQKGRFLPGSTADALLHSSPIPLGLTPRAVKLPKHGVTRIDCAFGDFEQDHSVISAAAELAYTWDLPLRIVALAPSGLATTGLDLESDLMHQWREQALAVLDRARDTAVAEFEDLTVETEIGAGTGWAGAMDAVKWKKGDLLFVGSSPMGPLERVFIGTETSAILEHSHVPVLIQPVQARAELSLAQ